MSAIIGFYASFNTNFDDVLNGIQTKDTDNNEQFRRYLWGDDGEGGLKAELANFISHDYGQDLQLILIQFNVNPEPDWPRPSKQVENYRPKERSIGAWIELNQDNYFSKDEVSRDQFIKISILDRLDTIRQRIQVRKMDIDADKLIKDVEKAFQSATHKYL